MITMLAIIGQSISLPTVLLFSTVVLLGFVNAIFSPWWSSKINAFMSSMPGPIPIPFVGTMYVLLGVKIENMCTFLLNNAKKYPKYVVHRWFDGQPILLTGDLEISNALLASQQNIEKSPDYKIFENGSRGLMSASGYKWRLTRNIMTPGFKTNIKGVSFADKYSRHLRIFLDILDKYSDEKEHDVFLTVNACVFDILCDIFGETQMDSQTKNTEFSQLLVTATEMMYERLFNPLLRPDWVYSLLGKQRKFKKITGVGETIVRQIVEEAIEKRNKIIKTNPTFKRPQTLSEIMLTSVDSGVIPKEDAIENVLDLSIAASVLPAAVLTGLMWVLSMYPDIQKNAYQEVVETCTGDEVTLDDLPKLYYVEMICKEALRHFTVPFFVRQLVEDLEVNDTTTIPAGVRIFLASYILHHNPEYWEKPGEFYPEHFTEANERKRPKGVYVPFSKGPRNCPGDKYTMQLMTIIIANTLLRYEFVSDKNPPRDLSKEKYRILFVLLPKERTFQIKRRQARKQAARSG